MSNLRRWRDYADWANDRLLKKLFDLPPEKLHEPIVSSFPSLFATLQHLFGWDAVWARRCWVDLHRSPEAEAARSLKEQVEQAQELILLRDCVAEIQSHWRQLVGSVESDRMIHYVNKEGVPIVQPFYQIVEHLSHHAAYHRGQIVTLMRQLGCEGISTDLVQFDRLHPS